MGVRLELSQGLPQQLRPKSKADFNGLKCFESLSRSTATGGRTPSTFGHKSRAFSPFFPSTCCCPASTVTWPLARGARPSGTCFMLVSAAILAAERCWEPSCRAAMVAGTTAAASPRISSCPRTGRKMKSGTESLLLLRDDRYDEISVPSDRPDLAQGLSPFHQQRPLLRSCPPDKTPSPRAS